MEMNQIDKRKMEVEIAFAGTLDVEIKGKEHIKRTS